MSYGASISEVNRQTGRRIRIAVFRRTGRDNARSSDLRTITSRRNGSGGSVSTARSVPFTRLSR